MRRQLLVVLVVATAGCGDSKEFGPPEDRFGGLADPVTDGEWYRPAPETTWQWQLSGTLNTSYDVEVYDADLFDTPASTIAALQEQGRHVICYFSGGSYEEWRSDAADFADEDIGRKLDGWKGERWLDIRSEAVFDIMLTRLDLAVEKGCDGVEPDNVGGFGNNTGFDLNEADQLAYNKATANAAHQRGLAIGLKNAGDLAVEFEPYYDFSLNEECHRYDECEQLHVFVENDKPVWNAEYADKDTLAAAEELADEICPQARNESLRTLVLPLELDDSFRVSCDE